MNLIFFLFLNNNNINGHHHYSLIEKKKVPKKSWQCPAAVSSHCFLVFNSSHHSSEEILSMVSRSSTSTNVQLGWNLKMKPRNMSRKLIRSSNTDRQSQHLLKTFFLQNSLFSGKMAFLSHCYLWCTLIWTFIQTWERGANVKGTCNCTASVLAEQFAQLG